MNVSVSTGKVVVDVAFTVVVTEFKRILVEDLPIIKYAPEEHRNCYIC